MYLLKNRPPILKDRGSGNYIKTKLSCSCERESGTLARYAQWWIFLAYRNCNPVYCSNTVQQACGNTSGYMFYKIGGDLHFLAYNPCSCGITYRSVKLVCTDCPGGIQLYGKVYSEPASHYAFLRIHAMVGVEAQAVHSDCLI